MGAGNVQAHTGGIMSDLIQRSQEVQIQSAGLNLDNGEDIYNIRRQIDQREAVKEFIRLEIARYEKLLEDITHEQMTLHLQLQSRGKPQGEPRKKRYLHSPESVGRVQLTDGRGNHIDPPIETEATDEPEMVQMCPADCGGCACHVSPPCGHCVEHWGERE